MLNTAESKLIINAQNDIVPIRKQIQTVGDEVLIEDKVALFNGNRYIATMSKKAADNLRTYGAFVSMLNEGMQQYSMDTSNISVKDEVHENGGKFMRVVDFNDIKVKFMQDEMILRLWAWTAYNLKWAEQFIFGPIVVICTNGLFHGAWKIRGMSKKNWTVKASLKADDISSAIEAFSSIPEMLEPMVKRNVKPDTVKHLFENTIAQIKDEIYPRVSDYRMRELSNHWDTYKGRYGSNLYAVYQTATHWASHPEGRGLSANKVRTRSDQVVDMLESNDWNTLLAA